MSVCSYLNPAISPSDSDLGPADCGCVVLWSLHSEKVSQKVDVGLKGRGPDQRPWSLGDEDGRGMEAGEGGTVQQSPPNFETAPAGGEASVSWPAENICFHLNK